MLEGTASNAHTRSAYRRGIANGILFACGMAFINPVTVIPIFVSRLTESDAAIGLVSAIGMSGWFLPQLFSGSYLQSRPRKRPLYVLTAFVRAFGLLCIIPLVVLLAPRHANLALLGFIFGYSLYAFGGGVGAPAFLDIVAKTVPRQRLGAFFGHREFWGGLAAICCGMLIRVVLSAEALAFPVDYCLLFALALLGFAPGWAVFASIDEPPGPVAEASPMLHSLRSAPATIRQHTALRLLIISRLLTGAAAIALPFYIIYCRRILELPEAVVGSYLSLQMAGSVTLIPLWAYLNDHRGARTLLISVAALSLSVPTTAFIATFFPHSTSLGQLAFGLVFFPLAALGGGSFMGYHNYLFSIAPEEHRPVYIGIHNTFFAVTGFLPLLGGMLLRLTSFHVLFALAAVLGITGLVATIRLPADTSRFHN